MVANVPIRYLKSLFTLAAIPEAAFKAELRAHDVDPQLLEQNGASIPAEIYGRIFVQLIKKMQPALLQQNDNLQGVLAFSTYRMMYEAMIHAPDLREAINRAAIYFQRFQPDGATFNLATDVDSAVWSFDLELSGNSSDGDVTAANFCMGELNWLPGAGGNALALATWHRTASWFIGHYIDLDRVELKIDAPPGKAYEKLFNTPIIFAAPHNALTFNRRYLEFPINKSESSLNTMLDSFPAELLTLEQLSSSVSSQIKGLLGSDFRSNLPTLPEIAARMHTTTATLHRRLKSEGTNWQQLKDDARRDVASVYLSSGEHTVSEVSELMGFSDDSTFYRAFKKWTGLTPRQYRDGSR